MSNRQKKLAKRKTKLKNRKKSQPQNNSIEATYIREGIKNEVFKCLADENSSNGMISITLYKKVTSDVVLMGAFNIDLYCLGVKEAFIKPGTIEQFEYFSGHPRFIPYKPEDAKKLIEDAVEYATKLGFKPHKDFKKAFRIFDNVDSSLSTQEYTFGKNGKPCFIAGPFDSPQKCKLILDTLKKNLGEGEYNFVMPSPMHEVFDEEAGEWEVNKELMEND